MTRKAAIKLLTTESEVVALDRASYILLLQLGLELAYAYGRKVAKIKRGFAL